VRNNFAVKLEEGTDVEPLVRYWANGTGKGYSAARIPGPNARWRKPDISHLLTPFARYRLYTYPFSENPLENGHDCFWSSMNFFNAEPDDRFTH
jgi:hypothetical protein